MQTLIPFAIPRSKPFWGVLHNIRPETCPKIKRFAQSKGVEFTMMNKVDVNGIDAHHVYHYLKKVAGPVSYTKNDFAMYHILSLISVNYLGPWDKFWELASHRLELCHLLCGHN